VQCELLHSLLSNHGLSVCIALSFFLLPRSAFVVNIVDKQLHLHNVCQKANRLRPPYGTI